MRINFETFLNWAKTHLNNIKVGGGKIKANSLWCDDSKRHLWCKPSIGYFHCWKSGKKGTLFDLIMEIEKCSYDEAVDILGGDHRLHYYETKVDALFAKQEFQPVPSPSVCVNFPPDTFSIKELSIQSPLRKQAEVYLFGRKLPVGSLYICVSGEYANRIIIPYYGPEGELVYWNARDLTGVANIRYKCPYKINGVNKENVLWMTFWPKNGTKIYLTEGEFDAMSLCQCGFHGVACGGKEVSTHQMQLLLSYQVCISFDNDLSGKIALTDVGERMIHMGLAASYVRPPRQYKDWNEMLCKVGKNVIKEYVKVSEKKFTDTTKSELCRVIYKL